MNLDELINGFKPIISSSDYYGLQTNSAAVNCIKTLEIKKFIFWLKVFAALMPKEEILYNVMHSTSLAEDQYTQFIKFIC